MQIAKVESGAVTQIGGYRVLFPETSFGPNGPTKEWLEANSCMQVSLFLPYDASTQKLVPCDPYVLGGWVYTVQVQPLTPEDLAARKESLAAKVRTERNRKLAASDWTQLADAPVDKTTWAVYRQALRDVTDQVGFPESVTWPTAPDAPPVVAVSSVTSNVSISGG